MVTKEPKRIAMMSIQNTHTMGMEEMESGYVRTGYEYIVPHRMGKLFAHMAKEPGKVISVDEYGIVVEYKSGKREGVELGVKYGRAEGTLYPNTIVTLLATGNKFTEGDPIAWNDRFFELDLFEGKLIYKHSKMVRVAMLEGEQTFEDSCSVSERLVNTIASPIGKMRSIPMEITNEVHDVIKAGDKVTPVDPLFVIQDGVMSGLDIHDGDLKSSLLNLASNAPKADYTGTVDRIEVYYNCELKEMSPTLKKLAMASDKLLKKRLSAAGKTVYTGKVTSDYRVNGKSLQPGNVEVRVYIIVRDIASNSDKIVVANQLKTTIGEIESTTYTESGIPIDLKFSRIAVDARIVGSFDEIAYLSTCLELATSDIDTLWNK